MMQSVECVVVRNQNGDYESPGGKNKKQKPLSDLTAEFGGQTSMHGIGKICDGAKCSFLHFLWALVVCGGISGATFQIYTQTGKFLKKPIRTLISVDSNGFVFPDVTFCDQMADQLDVQDHLFTSGWRRRIDEAPKSQNLTKRELYLKVEDLTREVMDRLGKYYRNTTNRHYWVTPFGNPQQHYSRLKNRFPWAVDKLIYCNFKGKKCTHEDFDTKYSITAKNCYKFKPRDRENSDQKTLQLMILSTQLSCECTDPKSFATAADFQSISQGTPISLKAVPKGSSPTNLENNIKVAIGQATSIQLVQKNMKFVHNHPRRICMPSHKMETYEDRIKSYYNYERELCLMMEYIEYVVKTCNCLPDWETIFSNETYIQMGESRQKIMKHYKGYRYCHNINEFLWKEGPTDYLTRLIQNKISPKQMIADINNRTHKNFVSNMYCYWLASYENGPKKSMSNLKTSTKSSKNSKCSNPCSYTHYSKTVSQNQWPISTDFSRRGSRAQMAKIIEYIEEYYRDNKDVENNMKRKLQLTQLFKFYGMQNESNRFDSCKEKTFDKVKCGKIAQIFNNNMLWLSISPATTNTMTFEEEVYYLFWDWLSDVGGTMGLWCGISLITVIEYGEFFLRAITLCCRR